MYTASLMEKCEQLSRWHNGGKATGLTAGQERVAGSEMTGELVYGKGREQIENGELQSMRKHRQTHLIHCSRLHHLR